MTYRHTFVALNFYTVYLGGQSTVFDGRVPTTTVSVQLQCWAITAVRQSQLHKLDLLRSSFTKLRTLFYELLIP